MLDVAFRFRFLFASALSAIMYIGGAAQSDAANDWIYFAWGSDMLFGLERAISIGGIEVESGSTGGLHLYAEHGFIQIGPPALLVAKAVGLLPLNGVLVAGMLVQLLGLLSLWLIDRAYRPASGPARFSMAVGMALVSVMWGTLARFVHLDDAMALTSIAGAVLAIRRQNWLVCGLLVGLAASVKPWGIVAAALVLAAPCARLRMHALAAVVGVVLAVWGPFVVADLGTLTLGEHHLAAMPSSPLRAIGLAEAAGTSWLRTTQLAVSLSVAAIVTLRAHWALGLLAGVAARLLLDPNDYLYYIAGLAVAAFIADVAASHSRFPLFCPVVAAFWLIGLTQPAGSTAGMLNAACYGSVLLLAILRSTHRKSGLVSTRSLAPEADAVIATTPS